MTPKAFAKYDELIRAMRRNREINRIEDSLICRLEFVHVSCPAEVENHTITAMRARLMAYSKGMPESRQVRAELQQVVSLQDVQDIADRHLDSLRALESMADGPLFGETRGAVLV